MEQLTSDGLYEIDGEQIKFEAQTIALDELPQPIKIEGLNYGRFDL